MPGPTIYLPTPPGSDTELQPAEAILTRHRNTAAIEIIIENMTEESRREAKLGRLAVTTVFRHSTLDSLPPSSYCRSTYKAGNHVFLPYLIFHTTRFSFSLYLYLYLYFYLYLYLQRPKIPYHTIPSGTMSSHTPTLIHVSIYLTYLFFFFSSYPPYISWDERHRVWVVSHTHIYIYVYVYVYVYTRK